MDIIKEFEKIRDIPYRIPLTPDAPDECCTGKAEMLINALRKRGYAARYRLGTFKWSSIELPEELQNIPHEDDSSHTYPEVNIGGQWRVIDATWDKGLRGIFDINEWDGKSATGIAVKCIECLSPEESLEHIKNISTRAAIIADLKVNGEFYKAFNEWLDKSRTALVGAVR
jgi:hypothetical protein